MLELLRFVNAQSFQATWPLLAWKKQPHEYDQGRNAELNLFSSLLPLGLKHGV